MRRLLWTLFVFIACSAPAPKAPAPAMCKRTCPVGQTLAPVTPLAEHVLDDCCVDQHGDTWSSCAWNRWGMFR